MTPFNLTLAKTLFPNKVSHSFGGNGSFHRARPSHTDSEESEWLGSRTIPSWPGLGEWDSQHSWGLPGCPTCPHRCRFPMSPLQGAADPRSARCPWTKPRQNAEFGCWAQAGLGPGEGSSVSVPQPRTQTPGRMGDKSENSWRREINTFACWMAEGLNLVVRAPRHFPGTCTGPQQPPPRLVLWTGTGDRAGSQAPGRLALWRTLPNPVNTLSREVWGPARGHTAISQGLWGRGRGPASRSASGRLAAFVHRDGVRRGALRTGEAGVGLIRAPGGPREARLTRARPSSLRAAGRSRPPDSAKASPAGLSGVLSRPGASASRAATGSQVRCHRDCLPAAPAHGRCPRRRL